MFLVNHSNYYGFFPHVGHAQHVGLKFPHAQHAEKKSGLDQKCGLSILKTFEIVAKSGLKTSEIAQKSTCYHMLRCKIPEKVACGGVDKKKEKKKVNRKFLEGWPGPKWPGPKLHMLKVAWSMSRKKTIGRSVECFKTLVQYSQYSSYLLSLFSSSHVIVEVIVV